MNIINGGFPPIERCKKDLLTLIKNKIKEQKNNKKRKYLLLSSVGPNSLPISNKWFYQERNYDLFLVFYGDKYFSNQSDYSIQMKGSKMEHYYYISIGFNRSI